MVDDRASLIASELSATQMTQLELALFIRGGARWQSGRAAGTMAGHF